MKALALLFILLIVADSSPAGTKTVHSTHNRQLLEQLKHGEQIHFSYTSPKKFTIHYFIAKHQTDYFCMAIYKGVSPQLVSNFKLNHDEVRGFNHLLSNYTQQHPGTQNPCYLVMAGPVSSRHYKAKMKPTSIPNINLEELSERILHQTRQTQWPF